MAQEETQKPAVTAASVEQGGPGPSPTPPPKPVPLKEEAPVTQEVPAPAPVAEKEVAVPAPESAQEKEAPVEESEKPEEEGIAAGEAEKRIVQSDSFKEESYVASELPESQRKALEEFKELVREALNKREFTTPPPAPVKEEDKVEEKKTEEETKEEEKMEVIEEKKEKKEETSAVTGTKPEEKPAVPAIAEAKKADKSETPAPVETKPAEKPVAPAITETKDEKPADPAPAETKKDKPASPAATETKKEEKPVAQVITETKKEEKTATPAPVEKPAAQVTTETKPAEKPAAPVETKPAEKSAAQVTIETKKEEKPAPEDAKPAESSAITIEKAFAADEDGAKTVEAIEETIVPVSAPETAAADAAKLEEQVEPEEVSIWGVPLLQDERSDVVLLKFLRARDFKVKEAFAMLKNTVRWRKENNIDELVGEDLEGTEFEKIVFAHGMDKQGHVVIYSAYSEFQNKELFSDKEKLNKFLKWRIQFQEKCVRALDFSPSEKSSFVFVSDFRNAPGLGKRALWQFIKRAVKQFEDNYPEFSAKELFINVPWWYIPYYRTFGSIVTSARTKSKMVLAGPSKSADTIFKCIAPEQVPVKYGGLSKESLTKRIFSAEVTVTETIVKSAAKYTIDLPASEACTLTWELRVLGSDVSYGAQFEPSTEGSYTVIVSKNRKLGLTDEPVITDSFKVGEPGKVVITIDNQSSKKKKLLYRFKTHSCSD